MTGSLDLIEANNSPFASLGVEGMTTLIFQKYIYMEKHERGKNMGKKKSNYP
jgi:hypothetical protein